MDGSCLLLVFLRSFIKKRFHLNLEFIARLGALTVELHCVVAGCCIIVKYNVASVVDVLELNEEIAREIIG